MKKILLAALLALCIAGSAQSILAAPSLQAAGQWPMLHNGAQRNGRGAATSGSNSVRWTFNTGGYVSSAPAVGTNGAIYVGSWDDSLYAFNPDGSQKWKFTTGDNVSASPTVGADGTIYIGSWDRRLYAVSPEGTQRWAFTT